MPEQKKKSGGWKNLASAANGLLATEQGRRPVKAEAREGDGVMISHVFPDGTADLGRGVARIRKVGNGRIIVLPQDDGSEIRILIVR